MGSQAYFYRIRVLGCLDPKWSEWFDGFNLEHTGEETVLTGHVPDQAALHGILAKIRDLDLMILLIEHIHQAGGPDV